MKRMLPIIFALALLGAAPTPAPVQPSPAPTTSADAAMSVRAADWVRALQSGKVDRKLLTPQMSAALTPEVLAAISSQLDPLGAAVSMKQTQVVHQGGNTIYVYALDFAHASLTYVFAIDDATDKVSGLRFPTAE